MRRYTIPKKHQREGALAIEKFDGRVLLADEMGVGKTLQALIWCARNKDKWPVVCVCPAHLKHNWEDEARTHYGMKVYICEGRTVPKHGIVTSAPLIIINYDILRTRVKGRWTWVEALRKLKPGIIIGDEIQAIANRKSLQCRAFRALCKTCPHIIACSGTPITSNIIQFWPILNILRPDIWPSYTEFGDEFCEAEMTPWGLMYRGGKNLKRLHRLLCKHVLIRRLKEDVFKDMPKKKRMVISVPIIKREEYKEAENNLIHWLLKKGLFGKAKRAAKAEQFARWSHLLSLVAELKRPAVKRWINRFLKHNAGDKVIVFGIHNNFLKPLYKQFQDCSLIVNGSVPSKERHQRFKRFNTDKNIRVLFGNEVAAGTGWNGTAASNAVIGELPFVPALALQCEDRCHRLGQKKRVHIYYLVAKDTIEEKMCRILFRKQKNINTSLDGNPGREKLDLLTELENTLIRKEKANAAHNHKKKTR